MIKELDYPSYYAGSYRRISWGAVFAGTITCLSGLMFLTALGTGLGLSETARAGQPLINTMTTGTVLWMVVSSFASFYAGGWVAGRLTDIARVSESVIHGLASWAAATTALAFAFSSGPGALGIVPRAVGTAQGVPGAFGIMDVLERGTEAGNVGIAGAMAFVMLACAGVAAAYGARSGTRVLRPVPMSEPTRERITR